MKQSDIVQGGIYRGKDRQVVLQCCQRVIYEICLTAPDAPGRFWKCRL